ncbi:MAG: hypothetical protein QXW58_05630 [Thermosphaera sp.]
MSEFRKAVIGEGLSSCDVCGRVDRVDRLVSIYHGDRGEKTDYCEKCLSRGVVRKRE